MTSRQFAELVILNVGKHDPGKQLRVL